MRGRALGAAAVVAIGTALLVGACSSGAEPSAASVTTARPRTTERQVPVPPSTTPGSTTSTTSTTEVVRLGLPDSLPISAARTLTLGPGSSMSAGDTVHGVPIAEVAAFVHAELVDLGYVVTDDDGTTIHFIAPTIVGTAQLVDLGGGDVDITLALDGAPR